MQATLGAAKTLGKLLLAAVVGASFAFVHTCASETASTIVVPALRKFLKKIRKFNAATAAPVVNVNFAQAPDEPCEEEAPEEEPTPEPEAPKARRGKK